MTDLVNAIDMSLAFNEQTVRVVGTSDNPMFVVKDICNILGIKNITDVSKIVPEKWRGSIKSNTSSGIQTMNTVNEAGLYKIIMRSKKPIAQPFQEFVCEEILPSIRKTGEYKYQKILDEKNKLEDENKSLHKLVKRKERKKYRAGSCVYIVKNIDIKDKYKIGETKDLTNRINDYGPGAPERYEAVHQRMVPSVANQKSIEDLVLTILEPFRIENDTKGSHKREWVVHPDLPTLKMELDGLVDYVNDRRRLYDPECNIYESESEIELEIEEEEPKKVCSACGESKVCGAYYKRTENDDGLEGVCKMCYAVRQKKAKVKKEIIVERNDGNKTCRVCKEDRDLAYFSQHNTSKDGYSYVCKLCQAQPVNTNNTEKKCSSCKEVKSVGEFTKCRTSLDGYFAYCGVCSKEKRKKYVSKKKENGPSVVVTEKKCCNCDEVKKVKGNFWRHPTSKDGFASNCNECFYKLRSDRKIQKTS
jgi:prophage antirepressor-like protein